MIIRYNKDNSRHERMEMEWNTNPIKQWTDNDIGAEGATQISETLKTNTTLTSLDLLGDDKDNNKQVNVLKWKTNPIKQWTDNRIGEEGAKKICESLKTNTTLASLNLTSDDKI